MSAARAGLAALVLGAAACGARAASDAAGPRDPNAGATLDAWVRDRAPWTHLEANSDHRQPLYFGLRPADLARSGRRDVSGGAREIVLPASLRELATTQVRMLVDHLEAAKVLTNERSITLEMWPVRDDLGRLTWAMTRFKSDAGPAWRWIDASALALPSPAKTETAPLVAISLDTANPEHHKLVFADFSEYDDLTQKPVYGDCVFTNRQGRIVDAWPPLSHRVRDARAYAASAAVCHVVGEPPRRDGEPFVVPVSVDVRRHAIAWPATVRWNDAAPPQPVATNAPRMPTWPPDFETKYRSDVRILSGEDEAVFPKTGRRERFIRKSSADPHNQLGDLASYLEERYAALGVATRRQSFVWNGIPEANVIAVVASTSARGDARPPVLLADHVDTAFAKAQFAKTRDRIAVPGADDDMTGAATLLRAAEILSKMRGELARDVWLCHLTGEEFPADDLGARELVRELIATHRDVAGVVLLDMIGYRQDGDPVFQVGAGDTRPSIAIAAAALAAARVLAPALLAVYRDRFDLKSYLYNTDGLIFSDNGFPVVLLNEHINYLENKQRAHYHELSDRSDTIDWEYATSIAKVAIATTLGIATATASPGAD